MIIKCLLRVILLFIFFNYSALLAQPIVDSSNSDTSGIEAVHLSYTARIKTDSLKTGVFLNRVQLIDELAAMQTGTIDTTSSLKILYALEDLQAASEPNNMIFSISKAKLEALRVKYRQTDTVCLVVLDAEFDLLDSSALDSGLVRFTADSLLESVPGNQKNPFVQSNRTWVALLSGVRGVLSTTSHIKFDPDGIISNRGKSITSITLNTGLQSLAIHPGETLPFQLQVTNPIFSVSATLGFSDGAQIGPIVSYSLTDIDSTAYYNTRCTIENEVREYGQKYVKEVV